MPPLRRLAATLSGAALLLTPSMAAAQAFAFTLDGVNNIFTARSITVGPRAATDLFSITVGGQVFLQTPGYGTNAAGVVRTAGSTPVGGASSCSCVVAGDSFGAVGVRVNGGSWFQLFPTIAQYGLGSPTPPATLSYTNVTVGSIFGGALAANSVIEFRIADTNTGDNSGSYDVSGSFSTPSPGGPSTPVPEPSTVALMTVGLGLAGFGARRRRA